MTGWVRGAAFAVPYVAVLVGLYGARSAWAAFVLYHLGIVVGLTLARWRASPGWSGGSSTVRWALGGAVLGVVGGGLMHLLWGWVGGDMSELRASLRDVGAAGRAWPMLLIYHAAVNPWLEEAYWRSWLAREGRLTPGDVAFAGYHVLVLLKFTSLGPAVLSFAVLVIVAAVWRAVTRHTGSLWPATVSHIVANAAIMFVVYRAVGR